jgi:hypothetical protein
VAALACGIAAFLSWGLTALPAIVLGHAARRRVRRTGQRGEGMALAGIILGWAAAAVVALLALFAITVASHAGHAVVIHDGPGFPANSNVGG